MSVGRAWPFRSPVSKLLRFFWRSRDQWRAKCKEAKRENKSLKYRLAKMAENRDRWQAEAKALRRSVSEESVLAEVGTKTATEHGSHGRRHGRARRGVAGAR